MDSILSQQQIGKRIVALRHHKGLSQEELANAIKISRSSLAQIELGNRNLNVLEFQKLSYILGFSSNDFLSHNFKILELSDVEVGKDKKDNGIRVSTPVLQINKLSDVLIYILEKCAGKPNIGEETISKLLYFSDFNYYELYEEHFTGATYHKLPFGPVPENFQRTINQMIKDDKLKRLKTNYHHHTQIRYIPLVKADLRNLKASEKDILDRVIDQFSDWSAKAINDYSHQDLPWIVTKEEEAINYELALYREAPYSVRYYEEETETQEI